MLAGMGVDFEILKTDVEETYDPSWTPEQIVMHLSKLKLSPIDMAQYDPDTIFIACDTIVVVDVDQHIVAVGPVIFADQHRSCIVGMDLRAGSAGEVRAQVIIAFTVQFAPALFGGNRIAYARFKDPRGRPAYVGILHIIGFIGVCIADIGP